jgi:hypothetical protein
LISSGNRNCILKCSGSGSRQYALPVLITMGTMRCILPMGTNCGVSTRDMVLQRRSLFLLSMAEPAAELDFTALS